MTSFRPTWDFAEYDCVIEYIFPSLQTMRDIMADPEWSESIKDQDDWVDVPKALVSVGQITPYFLNGEGINLP